MNLYTPAERVQIRSNFIHVTPRALIFITFCWGITFRLCGYGFILQLGRYRWGRGRLFGLHPTMWFRIGRLTILKNRAVK